MDPHYPHPVPDSVSTRTTFATGRTNVRGSDMRGLPNLGTLRANILAWLQAYLPGATFARDFNPSAPGKVLITANGQLHEKGPMGDMESAQVLNGDVPEASYHGPHQTWLQTNQKKWGNNAKAKRLAGDDAGNRIWTMSGGLLACARVVKEAGDTSGFTEKETQVVWINAHCDDGSMLVHEFFHAVEGSNQEQGDFGWSFDEGTCDFFARDVSSQYGYKYKGNIGYEAGYLAVKDIVDHIGLPILCKLWFERPAGMLSKLGPIAQQISAKRPVTEGTTYADVSDLVNQFCTEAARLEPALVVAPKKEAKKWPQVAAVGKTFRSAGGTGW